MKVYILGSGAMATAMAFGLKSSGFEVVLVARDVSRLSQNVRSEFACESYGERFDISEKNIILAFKPYALGEVSANLAGTAAVCVSVLARTKMAVLKSAVSAHSYAVAMPNLASEFCASVTPFMFEGCDICVAEEILCGFGQAVRVSSEAEFDAAGVLAGCAPAFFALFGEALCDAGVRGGLGRETAKSLTKGVVKSVGALVGKFDFGALRERVCSPAGTTIEGVFELENGGVRGAVLRAFAGSLAKQKM